MSNNEPLKWRKYSILCDFGLREFDDLNCEIHRFKIVDIDALVDAIRVEIEACPPKTSLFFVVKLVNNNAIFNLPNYRIYNANDLEHFKLDIVNKKRLYHEVWYCATKMQESNGNLSLAGRLVFTDVINGYEQTIEQIWNRSPRLIDEFSKSSDFVFVRANRLSWGFRYKPSVMHIPDSCTLTDLLLVEQFNYAVHKIESLREKIEIFEGYMQGFGFKSFSLEYKISDDKFKFIDWDTPNDRLVLSSKR